MKRQYITPAIVLVKTDLQAILAGSDLSLDTDKNKTFDGSTALSKKHPFTSEELWDESWDSEEEE